MGTNHTGKYPCKCYTSYSLVSIYHYIKLTRAIDIINNSTGGERVSAANATRGGESTERVFLIERAGVSPANGSSTPPHPSTVIDEHSIGVSTISDQNSLEGTGSELWVCVICGMIENGFTLRLLCLTFVYMGHDQI